MDKFSLNIAGNIICFRKDTDSPEFVPSDNLKEFISDSSESSITITVFNKEMPYPGQETELFSAPFIKEDEDGSFVKKSDKFWSVLMANDKKVIRIYDPGTGDVRSNLVISTDSPDWELYSSNREICASPYTYPLDGLILYYSMQKAKESELLAEGSDRGRSVRVAGGQLPVAGILIHASAVEYEGRGYLFTGVSGKGKTTISDLWKEAGAVVIHDDLVVLTHTADGSVMVSSTPLNGNVSARQTRLDAIFLIGHSDENVIDMIKGAEAFSQVLSNTIQHNYDSEIIARHLDNLMMIIDSVPVYRMGFRPEQAIVEVINSLKIGHEKAGSSEEETEDGKNELNQVEWADKGNIAVETVKAVLESGNSVELSAAGYSMYPTLRPRDRVIIKPLAHGELPLKGSVVVFIDEGSSVQATSGASSLNLWNEFGATAQTTSAKATVVKGRKGTTEPHFRGTGGQVREERGAVGPILVMHRVIDIINGTSNEPMLITRGDSRKENDKPWPLHKLMGRAVSCKRGMIVYPVKTFVPLEMRYNLCRMWLRVVCKVAGCKASN